MGDPGTPEGQALWKERSPLAYANAIKKPLLIVQAQMTHASTLPKVTRSSP